MEPGSTADPVIEPADRSWETEDPELVKRLVWWNGLSPLQRDLLLHPPKEHLPVQTIAVGARKVGPNDPCPCGSGRKLKRCCQHA